MARRTPLNRERVLRAAVGLADESGIESLSMRRLGQELGVEAMSLYNHVANKDEILDGIVDLVAGEAELPTDATDWKTAMRQSAISMRDAFLRHPWACTLALSPDRFSLASVQRTDWMLQQLREGGFPPEVTYHAYHALDAHILGFTLWQLGHGIVDTEHLREMAAEFFRRFGPEEYPYLREHAEQHFAGFGREGKGAYELVLDLILDGLDQERRAA